MNYLLTLVAALFMMFPAANASDKQDEISEIEKAPFRVLTYNVQHCMGEDGKIVYDRISSIINQLDADVVCLQEIDSVNGRTPDDQMRILGEKTGMYQQFSKSIDFMGGKYGNGMLSKKKPISVHRIALPGDEARSAIAFEFKKYVVIGTHLALEPQNRDQSIILITEFAKTFNKKVYLAGDFNAADFDSKFHKLAAENWDMVSAVEPTWPTGKPVECLDLVFTLNGFKYKPLKSKAVYVLPDVNVSNASDHYPLYADFK